MRREAGEQIGRKGNQTATSADGVDETGEKYKRTADKIGQKCDVHSGGTSVCGGYGGRSKRSSAAGGAGAVRAAARAAGVVRTAGGGAAVRSHPGSGCLH